MTRDKSGPAFPNAPVQFNQPDGSVLISNGDTGMTLYQYFASRALQGATANEHSGANSPHDLAHYACDCAHSMIEELKRRGKL